VKDINNTLIKAYYDALKPLGYPVYEGEEPDDTLDKMYIVISDVTSNDTSTKNSTDVNAQIQITINSWELKYNNSKSLNIAAGDVLTAIKPTPNAVLDLSVGGMQMMNLNVQNDNLQNYGKLAGRVYISRNIIFQQDIFIY
jgi:mannose/fructose/N-acetylgalactosamine-specific phosphotransferase system component IIB